MLIHLVSLKISNSLCINVLLEMKVAYDVYLPSSEEDQNKSPVILLHGRLDSRKTWKNFGPDIADKTGRKLCIFGIS